MVSVPSLAPMIAISGRWRFGGFRAANVASASTCAIGGAAPAGGAGGSESIQAAPIITGSVAAPKPLHNKSRLFMAISELPHRLVVGNKVGVEGNFPQVLVRILEVTGVAAPERPARRLYDPGARLFGPSHNLIDLTLAGYVVPD